MGQGRNGRQFVTYSRSSSSQGSLIVIPFEIIAPYTHFCGAELAQAPFVPGFLAVLGCGLEGRFRWLRNIVTPDS